MENEELERVCFTPGVHTAICVYIFAAAVHEETTTHQFCTFFGSVTIIVKVAKLDIARNIGGVQQLAGAWNSLESSNRPEMNDGRRPSLTGFRVEGNNDEEVICPKPRRPTTISCPVNEYLKPSRRRRSQATVRPEGDAGFDLLDIFLSKGGCGDISNFGCSPPYFSGSPPSRTGNPLIHDVEFLQQRAQSVLSHRGPTSFGGNPVVRVEGFASAGPDSRSRVSTLA